MITTPVFMFVDDDDDDRMLFESALKKVNPVSIFIGASDGRQALEILNQRKDNLPHLFFLDINMPGFSGWQVLEEIKNDKAYNDLKVIMFSTSNNFSDIEKALAMGAFCFCTKPDTFTELVRFLEIVVDKVSTGDVESLKAERHCNI